MNNQTAKPLENSEIEIDLLHLIKILWQKAWLIALCAVLLGAITFSYAFFFITPLYQAKAMMYVNNNSLSLGGTSVSITASEINAARSLLDILP